VSGYRYGSTTSKHYVNLVNDDGDNIRIYNSFDGSLALRVYLTADEFQFNLVSDHRVIHRGDKARNVNDINHLYEIKESILRTIPNMKELKVNLSKTKIDLDSELTELINESVSKRKLYYLEQTAKKGKFQFINYTSVVAEKMEKNGKPLSIYNYINLTIKNFLDGHYGIKDVKTGFVKAGRKTNSPFAEIRILNDITKAIEEKLPEYLI
jgi:hypothetical protein